MKSKIIKPEIKVNPSSKTITQKNKNLTPKLKTVKSKDNKLNSKPKISQNIKKENHKPKKIICNLGDEYDGDGEFGNINLEYIKYYSKFCDVIQKLKGILKEPYFPFNDARNIIEIIEEDDIAHQILNHFKLIIYNDLLNYYYDPNRNDKLINERYNYNMDIYSQYIDIDVLDKANIKKFFNEFQGECDEFLKNKLNRLLLRIKLPHNIT